LCEILNSQTDPIRFGTLFHSYSLSLTFSHYHILAFSHSCILAFSHSRILAFSRSRILAFSHSRVLAFLHSRVLAFSRSRILAFSRSRILAFSYSHIRTFAHSHIRPFAHTFAHSHILTLYSQSHIILTKIQIHRNCAANLPVALVLITKSKTVQIYCSCWRRSACFATFETSRFSSRFSSLLSPPLSLVSSIFATRSWSFPLSTH
jgi:hypothetical protein